MYQSYITTEQLHQSAAVFHPVTRVAVCDGVTPRDDGRMDVSANDTVTVMGPRVFRESGFELAENGTIHSRERQEARSAVKLCLQVSVISFSRPLLQ